MKTIKWRCALVSTLFLVFNALSIGGCVGTIGDPIDDENLGFDDGALAKALMQRVFPIAGHTRQSCSDSYGAPRPNGRTHKGVDCFAPLGTELVAVEDGYIRYAKVGGSFGCKEGGDFSGNRISLTGNSGTRYYYGHLKDIYVSDGLKVKKGDVIGTLGNTGNALCSVPHLHFEISNPPWYSTIDPYPVMATWSSTGGGIEMPPSNETAPDPTPPVNQGPITPTGQSGMPASQPMRLQMAGPKRIADREISANTEEFINVLDTGIPTSDVHAAVLNLVVDKPEGGGYGQVWAAEEPIPPTSAINFLPGETRANLIVVQVNPSGLAKVKLTTFGKARMVVDVVGYFAASGNLGLLPVQQRRVLGSPVPVPAHGTLDVDLGISHSVAVISLTAVGTSSPGYLAAYRQGSNFGENFSTLNYGVNQDIANQAWVEPNNGIITIYNNGATAVPVHVDVNAAFDASSNAGFVRFASPARVYDTRDPQNGALAPNGTTLLHFGAANVPDSAIGLAYNMTMIQPYSDGYGAIHASDSWPGTSVVNFAKGHDVASGGVTLLGADHQLRVTNGPAITHMAMDVAGYFMNP